MFTVELGVCLWSKAVIGGPSRNREHTHSQYTYGLLTGMLVRINMDGYKYKIIQEERQAWKAQYEASVEFYIDSKQLKGLAKNELEWPSQSSDWNPIGIIWQYLRNGK